MRDDEIQDALDCQPLHPVRGGGPSSPDGTDAPDAGDIDGAAYALVYAALAEDAGFALPAGFAESIAAAAMPEPARVSVFERAILPLLLLGGTAVAAPAVVPSLARAFRLVLGAPDGGLSAAAVAALVLLLVAGADRLARRGGWAPRT